jgi:uncharacterized protein YkwD
VVRSGSGGDAAASGGPLSGGSDEGDDRAVPTTAVEDEDEATPTPQATATPTATSTPQPALTLQSQAAAAQPENYTAEVLASLNAVRTQQGLPALMPNPALAAAAASYARYMAEARFFGHFGPDGSSPRSRIAAAGFTGIYKGEALTAGHPSPNGALQALLASPPHAAILLDRTAVAVGVGYYYLPGSPHQDYWVVVTGNP